MVFFAPFAPLFGCEKFVNDFFGTSGKLGPQPIPLQKILKIIEPEKFHWKTFALIGLSMD